MRAFVIAGCLACTAVLGQAPGLDGGTTLAALRDAGSVRPAGDGLTQAQLDSIKSSAEGGAGAKLYQLALLYLYGHAGSGGVVVAPAHATAASLMRRAAEAGYAPAQTALASMLLDGTGLRADKLAAVRWLETAASDGGDPDAMWLRGRVAMRGRDPATAERWVRRALAAKPDHAPALFSLGVIHEYRRGAPDPAEAVRLYRESSRLGHSEAGYHLALCLLYGRGVPQGMAEAAALLQGLVGRGHGAAAFWLGSVLMQGRGGVDVDYDRARALFDQAVASGDHRVQKEARRAASDLSELLAMAAARREEVLGWVRAGGTGAQRTAGKGKAAGPAAPEDAEEDWNLSPEEAAAKTRLRQASAGKRQRLGDALARARARERGRLGIPARPHGENVADAAARGGEL